jgi:hypothetical protein
MHNEKVKVIPLLSNPVNFRSSSPDPPSQCPSFCISPPLPLSFAYRCAVAVDHLLAAWHPFADQATSHPPRRPCLSLRSHRVGCVNSSSETLEERIITHELLSHIFSRCWKAHLDPGNSIDIPPARGIGSGNYLCGAIFLSSARGGAKCTAPSSLTRFDRSVRICASDWRRSGHVATGRGEWTQKLLEPVRHSGPVWVEKQICVATTGYFLPARG